jgi:predicted DNA-binding transcriptional regulator AlpA
MPDPHLVTQLDVARALGVSSSTVQHWRTHGRIPTPLDLGPARSVMWKAETIEQWSGELAAWADALTNRAMAAA